MPFSSTYNWLMKQPSHGYCFFCLGGHRLDISALGILPPASHQRARPENRDQLPYGLLSVRQRSFQGFPHYRLDTNDLAEAGFYYVGYDDEVKCFYCEGSLYGWNVDDDPWEEHAR